MCYQTNKGMAQAKCCWNMYSFHKRKGRDRFTLNVNRYNKALYFYEKHGFTIAQEVDIEIGEGYFMNDYIMKLSL